MNWYVLLCINALHIKTLSEVLLRLFSVFGKPFFSDCQNTVLFFAMLKRNIVTMAQTNLHFLCVKHFFLVILLFEAN